MSETDRKHVPWGSCEKNFEHIVIRTWPRCRCRDIVCVHCKIVTGTGIHRGVDIALVCVRTTWCIFLWMQTSVPYISKRYVWCNHSLAWWMHITQYSIVHYIQAAALCTYSVNIALFYICNSYVLLYGLYCGCNVLMFYPSWNTDQGV